MPSNTHRAEAVMKGAHVFAAITLSSTGVVHVELSLFTKDSTRRLRGAPGSVARGVIEPLIHDPVTNAPNALYEGKSPAGAHGARAHVALKESGVVQVLSE